MSKLEQAAERVRRAIQVVKVAEAGRANASEALSVADKSVRDAREEAGRAQAALCGIAAGEFSPQFSVGDRVRSKETGNVGAVVCEPRQSASGSILFLVEFEGHLGNRSKVLMEESSLEPAE